MPESSIITRFRWIARAEGVSFLVLLFIAMPMKYLADDMPLDLRGDGPEVTSEQRDHSGLDPIHIELELQMAEAAPLSNYERGRLAVKYVGWVHGILFIGYWVAAVPLFTKLKWDAERIIGLGAASVLPFGTFVMEAKWLKRGPAPLRGGAAA